MNRSTIIGGVAGFAGALVIGTVAVANAGTNLLPGATPTPGQTAPGEGQGGQWGPMGGMRGDGRPGGQEGARAHTPLSATDLAKVKAAVAAKDSGITVVGAHQDADGSYDVMGTKAGQPVRVEVSKDLATVEVRTGEGPGEGRHGMHGMTPVDAATLAKVKAAVAAKDAAVTVDRAMQLPDGSYGAMGTKSGSPVMAHLSKDLRTVDVRTGMGRGMGHGMRGHHGMGAQDGQQGSTPTTVPTPGATGASYSA